MLSKNVLFIFFVFLVSIASGNVFADSSKKPAAKPAAKKKQKSKLKYDLNRRNVPVKFRLVRDWGVSFGLRYTYSHEAPAGSHVLDLVIHGYKCFANGDVCITFGVTADMISWSERAVGAGVMAGLEWNPLSNRHWGGVFGDFGIQWLPIRPGLDATRFYAYFGGLLRYRAFGDNAHSVFKLKVGMVIGMDVGKQDFFLTTTSQMYFGIGVNVEVDIAGLLRGKAGSISIFNGRSSNRPTGTQQYLNNWGTIKQANDRDGDGIADRIDLCPTVRGPLENKGCPYGDTDGDGLSDKIDRCPKKPGPLSNMGCPKKPKTTTKPAKRNSSFLDFNMGPVKKREY